MDAAPQPSYGFTDAEIKSALRNAPKWVSEDMFRRILTTFQPYYPMRLTLDDALEIAVNMNGLFRVLSKDVTTGAKFTGAKRYFFSAMPLVSASNRQILTILI